MHHLMQQNRAQGFFKLGGVLTGQQVGSEEHSCLNFVQFGI